MLNLMDAEALLQFSCLRFESGSLPYPCLVLPEISNAKSAGVPLWMPRRLQLIRSLLCHCPARAEAPGVSRQP